MVVNQSHPYYLLSSIPKSVNRNSFSFYERAYPISNGIRTVIKGIKVQRLFRARGERPFFYKVYSLSWHKEGSSSPSIPEEEHKGSSFLRVVGLRPMPIVGWLIIHFNTGRYILVATPKWPSSYCLLCPFTQRHYDVRVAWLPYFPKLWFTSITEWPHLLSHSGTSLFDAAPGRQEHLCIRPGNQASEKPVSDRQCFLEQVSDHWFHLYRGFPFRRKD